MRVFGYPKKVTILLIQTINEMRLSMFLIKKNILNWF